MTPEAKVKARVKSILNGVGAYHFSPATGGYGRSGVPDIVVCYEGKFIGIECKAGNNVPTALQYRNLAEIEHSGGIAFIVNEDNINQFERILNEHSKKNKTLSPTGE